MNPNGQNPQDPQSWPNPQAPFQGQPQGQFQQPQPQIQPQPIPQAPVYGQPGVITPAHASVDQNFVRVEQPKTWKILGIVFIVLFVVAAGLAVWALLNYIDQRDNVDQKVSVAVTEAVKEQADADAAKFEQEEKKPNRIFTGPEDLGSVSFDYPKTWSVYIAKDASTSSTFEAYLNPGEVPAVSARQKYATRLTIESKDYDKAVESFASQVKNGNLKSSSIKVNGDDTATRFDGEFSKDLRGSLVMFKLRDKTVTVRTDADTFKNDFDELVKTINFNE